MDRAFAGDKELITDMQAILGYSLTGITAAQKFWIRWGTGANGKSTMIGTVRHGVGGGGNIR